MSNDHRVSNLIPSSRTFKTDDSESLSVSLDQMYRDVSVGVNTRTIGNYSTTPSLTGNTLYGIESKPITTYRIIVQASSILNGTTNIAHGVNNLSSVRTLSLIGGASSPSTSSFLPLPFVNVGTPGNGIQIDVNGANIQIITTSGSYTGYSAWIVWEYALIS